MPDEPVSLSVWVEGEGYLSLSLAYHRVLWMPRDACVICTGVAVHGEAASAHENWERRYDEQSFHLRYPEFVARPGPSF
jgi:hypothetical protein